LKSGTIEVSAREGRDVVADTIRGLSYEICRGVCSFCGEVGSVLESVCYQEGVAPGTICEHCALAAGVAWRRLAGEVPPGFPGDDVARISSVSVLVARRRLVPDPSGEGEPEPGPRQAPAAYEFLTVPSEGGGCHVLPSYPLPHGADVRVGACRALEGVGLCSWPGLCETLHVGYTPRGRLQAVVLARGYALAAAPAQGYSDRVSGVWKPWPLSAHAGEMAGFYAFMEHEWPLRLYRLCEPGDRLPFEASVSMREAARRFVDLQSVAGAGGEVDTSMMAAYRSVMTADESAAAELVRRFGEEERRRETRKCLGAMPAGDGESGGESGDVPGTAAGTGDDVGLDGGSVFEDGGDEGGDGGGDGGGEGRDDSQPEPGFARVFRKG